MFEGLGQILENFITDFSFRRLTIYGILGIMIIGSVMIYENYSGHFKLSRLEKTTELLEKLSSIQKSENITDDKELSEIYNGIKNDLLLATNKSQISFVVNPLVWRGLLSGSLWLLLAVSTIPGIRRGEKDKVNQLIGSFILAAVKS